MSTKKLLEFNKKNTLALADLIYSDKNGAISFLKLCTQQLSNGKDGGRTTHCAIGEAYFAFVNRNMDNVNRDEDATDDAIIALVEVAKLKKLSDKHKLYHALARLPDINDNLSIDTEDYLARAEKVANVFRNKIAPFLK